MCTAVSFLSGDHYFGRTLDYACGYGEAVVITPRRYPFRWRCGTELREHYAMIGVAHPEDEMPLYYDAVNEKGLCAAGLRFAESACYSKARGKGTVASFELIPYLLAGAATVAEARGLLENIVVTDEGFSRALPPAPLHFMLADGQECLVVEAVREGLRLYGNPTGVLANEPPFPEMLRQLARYRHLTAEAPSCRLGCGEGLPVPEKGAGALGLPGDGTSPSRFVRAAFTRQYALPGTNAEESVHQMLHILGTVEQVAGCCRTGEDAPYRTLYTSCCNATRGIYYYTTYHCRSVVSVELWGEELDGTAPVCYPMLAHGCIWRQNG